MFEVIWIMFTGSIWMVNNKKKVRKTKETNVRLHDSFRIEFWVKKKKKNKEPILILRS